MGFDLATRFAKVVDGTGMPALRTDLGVRGERIEEDGDRVIDADGLIRTPGFIDVHAHYDVQLDWVPTASPSSRHGVTTVLAGNCDFTLAPARPEDVYWLAGMLSRVEGRECRARCFASTARSVGEPSAIPPCATACGRSGRAPRRPILS